MYMLYFERGTDNLGKKFLEHYTYFSEILCRIVHDHRITYIVFRNKQDIYKNDLSFPYPPWNNVGTLWKTAKDIGISQHCTGERGEQLSVVDPKVFQDFIPWSFVANAKCFHLNMFFCHKSKTGCCMNLILNRISE